MHYYYYQIVDNLELIMVLDFEQYIYEAFAIFFAFSAMSSFGWFRL